MVDLVLDTRRGATADALLGALVEVGASVEAIDAAVSTLGSGDVRLQVQASPSGSSVRVRAPEGAPTHGTWQDLRPRVALLAVDDEVRDRALAILDALFRARADVHHVQPGDVDVDPLAGPDDLAEAVALAAATVSVGAERMLVAVVGHGTGILRSVEGEVVMPGPVVQALLADLPTTGLDLAREIVDPIGAAFLAALATVVDTVPATERSGRGRLPSGSSIHVGLTTVSGGPAASATAPAAAAGA